jgi:hypothetical protein
MQAVRALVSLGVLAHSRIHNILNLPCLHYFGYPKSLNSCKLRNLNYTYYYYSAFFPPESFYKLLAKILIRLVNNYKS